MSVSMIQLDAEGQCLPVVAGDDATLPALQKAVGGLVDVMRLPERIDMWIADEGAFTETVNAAASLLAELLGLQPIVWGTVVFAGSTEDGATVSLTQGQVQAVTEWLMRAVNPEIANAAAAAGSAF